MLLWISLLARYVHWWSARAIAGPRRKPVRSSLLLAFLALAFLMAVLRLARVLDPKLLSMRETLTFTWAASLLRSINISQTFPRLFNIALALILFRLLYAVYRRARGHLAIAGFSNYTGETQHASFVEGLASRVRTELATIAMIYQVLDEEWSSPPRQLVDRSSRPQQLVDLMPDAQDPGELLRSTATADAKVNLGFASFSLGPVLTAFSRLVQGPRLSGGLHRSRLGWLLVAEVSGRGLARGWTVDTDDLAATVKGEDRSEPMASPLDRLPEALAYRIFTDLSPIGSNSWRAIYHYTHGLAAFRETLRTSRDRRLNLLHAEQLLRRSLEDDNNFARCHYNLGIVYRHLGNLDSAEAAFLRALEEGHDASETYLALADTYFADGRFDDCLFFAESARRRRPSALAWNLTGRAYRQRYEQESGKLSDQAKLAVLRSHRQATALSWRALCASIASGQNDGRAVQTAVRCLRDLAVAAAELGRAALAERLLRQVEFLAPGEQSIQLQLGQALFRRRSYSKAIKHLRSACEDRSDPARHAECELLAMAACLHLGRQEGPEAFAFGMAARFHYDRILDDILTMTPEARKRLLPENFRSETWTQAAEYLQRLRAASEFLDTVEAAAEDRERLAVYWQALHDLQRKPPEDLNAHIEEAGDDKQSLHRRIGAALAAGLAEDRSWALGQVAIKLSQWVPLGEVRDLLEDAISRLASHHQDQIRRQSLHSQLGWVYLQLAKEAGTQARDLLGKAVLHAEHAVALEPDGAWERKRLAEIYEYLQDFEHAESELDLSIRLNPNDSHTVGLIANIVWLRGTEMREAGARRLIFEQGVRLLKHDLKLIESEPLAAASEGDQLNARAWCHHMLGVFYAELRMYGLAITHLKVALSLGYRTLASAIDLASAYHEAKAYNEADTAFRVALAIANAQRAKRSGPSREDPGTFETELARLLLGWAMLNAELGLELDKAERLTRCAQRHLIRIGRPRSRHPEPPMAVQKIKLLRGKYHQCRGVIYFQRDRVVEATIEIESALALMPLSYSYLLLARYLLATPPAIRPMTSARRRQIREACSRVRETDVRGEYTVEIDEILGSLAELPPTDRQVSVTIGQP